MTPSAYYSLSWSWAFRFAQAAAESTSHRYAVRRRFGCWVAEPTFTRTEVPC